MLSKREKFLLLMLALIVTTNLLRSSFRDDLMDFKIYPLFIVGCGITAILIVLYKYFKKQ